MEKQFLIVVIRVWNKISFQATEKIVPNSNYLRK